MKVFIASLFLWCLTVCGAHAAFFQGAVAGAASCSTPTNSVAPAVTPTSGAVGQLFTSTSGTWTGSPTFAYQWYQVDLSSPISGATSSTYTAQSGDVGHTLGSQVVASSGACSSSAVASNTTSTITSGGSSVAFTPLHTFFMAANGNDACNGTTTTIASSGSCAWLTPNHTGLVCGDVIIANSGTYTSTHWSITNTPSTCPSTTGGIDGLGGVNFVSVVCAVSFACNETGSVSSGSGVVDVAANNWNFEGFTLSAGGATGWCFQADGGATSTTQHSYIAAINNICTNAGIGFGTQDNGLGSGTSKPGIDYLAFVGNITQNANQRADFPSASIVFIGMSNIDTNAGTHATMLGNFAINNSVTISSSAYSDLEGLMVDSPDVHLYTGQMYLRDNMAWNSSWVGFQIFQQTFGSSALPIYMENNTLYGNGSCIPTAMTIGTSGNINFQLNGGYPWTINFFNNLSVTNRTDMGCSGSSDLIYAGLFAGAAGVGSLTFNNGGSGVQNILYGASDNAGTSNSHNTITFNGFTAGTNTTTNPSLANTSDLITNWLTAPNCSGFTNTAACMGWNYGSQTATANTPIADLAPTAGGTSGKGYRPPAACASDSLYPVWLKGVVFLQASGFTNGATLTENAGLVNQPCGL